MEETRKAGKKSNIEINEDKGAKQNSHPFVLLSQCLFFYELFWFLPSDYTVLIYVFC